MLKELLNHSYIAPNARVVLYTTVGESAKWKRDLSEAGVKERERQLHLHYKKVSLEVWLLD